MKTTQILLADSPSLGGASHIEKSFAAIPGVQEAKVEREARRVTIQHEDVDETKLVNAVRATGLPAELIPQDAEVLAPPLPRMETPP